MRAAIYARYSTDKQSGASLDDQLHDGEKLARRHGFKVVATFHDAAISGGTAKRPGYQQMLAAARRGEFEVIVAEDTSRLWRAMSEQAPRLAELGDLGVHVVTHDFDTRSESAEWMGPILGTAAQVYRKEGGRRSRRGQEGRVRSGKSGGGRAYGYAIEGDTRRIEPKQAAIVKRIFEQYASGVSPRVIAAKLNEEGVPSPGATWHRTQRRSGGWLASTIHGQPELGTGILNNDLYRGAFVWNRTKWTRSAQDSSQRKKTMNPRSEWIERREEALRIVSDELWQRVKARQQAAKHGTGKLIRQGQRQRKAGAGRPVKYLLTGLLKCGECGGSFTLANRKYYGCSSYVYGRACTNSIHVRRELVTGHILEGVQALLRDPAVISELEKRVKKLLARKAEAPVVDAKRVGQLRKEVGNLTDAIAGGMLKRSPALAERLAKAEDELERLERQASRPSPVVRILPGLSGRLAAMSKRLEEVLTGDDAERGRAALADLAPEGIRLNPDPSRSFLIAEADVETPLKLAVSGESALTVAGAGFEPATFGL